MRYVFVIDTKNAGSYGPHGLRVSTHNNLEELVTDLVDFFGECEGKDTAAFDGLYETTLHLDDHLSVAIEALAEGRKWALTRDGEYVG